MQSFGSKLIIEMGSDHFSVKGVEFKIVRNNFHLHKTDERHIVILKSPGFLSEYDAILSSAPTKNVLELGVFEGGSMIYFALAFPDFRFVGVDIRPPDEAVLKRIRDLGLQDRLKIYYSTSQADPAAINKIMSDEFGNEAVGTIIDDASHDYDLSRKSFELTFCHIATKGVYCLEDWSWAHWGEPFQTTQWINKPALSNLVFEFVMLMGTGSPVISGLQVHPNVVQVRRGGTNQRRQLDLNSVIRMRGNQLALI